MSKKYILEVKEEHYGSKYFPKPIECKQRVDTEAKFFYNVFINTEPSLLTQDEINELPYGFVNMFNIVEVEDIKYYWRKKKEHLCSFEDVNYCYLNSWLFADEIVLKNTVETSGYKTKFTEQEAKKLLGDDFEMFERVDIA